VKSSGRGRVEVIIRPKKGKNRKRVKFFGRRIAISKRDSRKKKRGLKTHFLSIKKEKAVSRENLLHRKSAPFQKE